MQGGERAVSPGRLGHLGGLVPGAGSPSTMALADFDDDGALDVFLGHDDTRPVGAEIQWPLGRKQTVALPTYDPANPHAVVVIQHRLEYEEAPCIPNGALGFHVRSDNGMWTALVSSLQPGQTSKVCPLNEQELRALHRAEGAARLCNGKRAVQRPAGRNGRRYFTSMARSVVLLVGVTSRTR